MLLAFALYCKDGMASVTTYTADRVTVSLEQPKIDVVD